MKTIQTSLCLLVAVLLIGVALAGANADREESNIGHIKAKSLSIVDGSGKSVITMMDTGRGPGIWMTSPSGNHVILTAIDDQTAIYVMGKSSNAADLALCLDADGKARIQTRKANGEFRMIDPAKLAVSE